MERSIAPLTIPQARQIYLTRMTEDFPPDELKPWFAIHSRLLRGEYACLGLYEDQALAGYAFFAFLRDAQGRRNALFDYFAMLPALRGRGLGGDFLHRLSASMSDTSRVILEAENPDYADDAADRALRRRRLDFYLRNGMADTGVEARIYGVEYRILAFPPAPDADETRQLLSAFYHSFFPPLLYRQKVCIR